MEYLKDAQLNIMLFFAGVCATTSFFVFFTGHFPKKQKTALFIMDISGMVILLADRSAYMVRGETGDAAFYTAHICNFLTYVLIPVILYAYNIYLIDIWNEGNREAAFVPGGLKAAKVLLIIDFSFFIISQLFGFCYTIDDRNQYSRGPGYYILALLSLIVILLQIIVIIRHRNRFGKGTLCVLLLFSIVPVVATVIQVFIYGVSLTSLSLIGMVVVLYVFTLLRLSRQTDEYMNEIVEMTAEKQRVSTELTIATKIQADSLPTSFPAFPDRKEFEVYASMTPAKEVGGDFYDFFLLDDDHLCLVIADVSGKGIPAALFMMMAKNMIHDQINARHDPGQALEAVNTLICANNRERMFITVWIGILEISTGSLTASNAGHEYPVFKKPDGQFEMIRDKHGFVIGGRKKSKYTNYEIHMEPGSKLFVYTDGVSEATDSEGRFFGTDRTIEALRSAADSRPEHVLYTVEQQVRMFAGEAEQFDDLTMMCIEYYGADNTNNLKELTVEADIKNLDEVFSFVNERLDKCGIRDDIKKKIDLAVDEIFANIVNYAYDKEKGEVTIRVEVDQNTHAVFISFIDSGMPFNPLKTKAPDITLPAGKRTPGGLGLFIVRETMDDVTYEYTDGHNFLRITKYYK